jgi:hypothetical protein
MGKKRRSRGKQSQTRQTRKTRKGGFFHLPAIIGSLFGGGRKSAPPRRRQPPQRVAPPRRPNYAMQTRSQRGPPRGRRQQGGFLTDSINYGFDETVKKSKKGEACNL